MSEETEKLLSRFIVTLFFRGILLAGLGFAGVGIIAALLTTFAVSGLMYEMSHDQDLRE